MCRYSDHIYKDRYVCVDCRKAFKILSTWDHIGSRYEPLCPDCGKEMVNAGHDFSAPKKQNIRQWKKVASLLRENINFNSCGCAGPGYRPRTLREVPDFIDKIRRIRESEGEVLLRKIKAKHD